MKRHKYLAVAICISFFSVLLLVYVKNVWSEVKVLPSDEFSEKREYIMKAKEKLDELGKKINELEEKVDKDGSKKEANAKKTINELREERAVLQINIEKLDTVSKDKWKTARQEVESEMDELEKAYHKARHHFGSE